MIMTPKQALEYVAEQGFVVLKYVRVGDEYRFAIPGFGPDHIQMLRKDEQATSASFATIDCDKGKVITRGESSTLKMGPADDDAEKIKVLLGFANVSVESNRT